MVAKYGCFEGKVVAIVGGVEGIGRSCALMFAEERAKVVVIDINDSAGAELCAEVERRGGWLRYVKADATKPDEMAGARACAEREGDVGVLVNCVGGFTQNRRALDVSSDEWDTGLRLNLNSVFYSCTEFARLMRKSSGGAIVNISSLAARGVSGNSPVYYSVAKAGVEVLTRVLAAELGRDSIRVNAVAPGTTVTPRIRKLYTAEQLETLASRTTRGKLAHPDEIASAVLFLASDDAVHVTGACLYANGGLLIIP